jgi:putative hydrolase of the HAD superfamily
MKSPTAVIFDYGCVLSLPQAREDVQKMASVLGAPLEEFDRVMWKHRLAYDQADLSPAEYWSKVAGEFSRTLAPGQIETLVEIDSKSWANPHPVTPRWAEEIRAAGLRTAILSNMPTPLREYLDSGCPWLPEFDHRTFSCDVRTAKPMREIYTYCLEGLKVEPGEALFLDDREENIRAAEAMGIHTLLFTSVEEAACEMERRFNIPLPG